MAIETKRGRLELLSGNYAAAYAAKLARVEVISAYPITPQTTIVEKLAEFVATGEMKARFINVESEHSVLSALMGACQAGARTFTASSSQGLAYMHEAVHWAGRGRCPIVMVAVNRGLGAPFHIGAEQDDTLSNSNTGWLQFYCEDSQEILDTVLQAYRIAEQVSLPVMVVSESIYLSHVSEPVWIPSIELVDQYLPKRQTRFKLDPDHPYNFGSPPGSIGAAADVNATQRRRIQEAMEVSKVVAGKAMGEFDKVFGRSYGVIECYQTPDAEVILVTSGTITGAARQVVDTSRKEGKKVGLLKIRMFRPFPTEDIVTVLRNARKVAVIDKNVSFGHCGVFAMETKAAMYNEKMRPPVFGFITGLGGIPVTLDMVTEIVDYTYQHDEPEAEIIWEGIKP